jgi:AhpC/TSA family
MYPHERSLVKRLQSSPFALLGINSDTDKEEVREAMAREPNTWRYWWDGSKKGPIATRWNVSSWPTIYVLDAKGVIRYKQVRDSKLDKAVDTLLRELAADKTP